MNQRKFFDIAQYIDIEEVKDQEEKVIFRLINLRLNNESLSQILKAKSSKYKLRVSPELKFQLYRCMISDGETNNNISRFQSGLTFCTYYEFAGAEKIVIQSVISPSGDIMQQIRRDYLDFPERILKIAAIHHWVLERLMRQMRLKTNVKLNWIPVILASVVSLIIVILGMVIYQTGITIINVIGLVIMWVLFYIGFALLLKLFLPHLKKWIGYQVLLQLLLPNRQYKPIKKSFLGKFIE